MEKKITKDMIISEILNYDPNMANVLMSGGMHCVTCPASLGRRWKRPAMYTELIRS